MTWFLRKSVRLGPVRFNLSKSGIGTSIGVRGLRVGQDARGRGYLFGRVVPGLYVRERLGRSGAPPIGLIVALAVGLLILAALFLH